MQPHDQDELRRKAQEVLARRISMEPDTRSESRPTAEQPGRSRQNRQPARRSARRPARSEEEFERQRPVVEAEALPVEPVEEYMPPEIQQPMARTERRRYEEPTPQSEVGQRRFVGDQSVQIRRALRSRESVRQAIVLNEILGKPVSLRDEEGPGTFGSI